MKFETRFDIGQRVVILGLDETETVVRGIKIVATGRAYLCTWFTDGAYKEEWLFEDEISEA